MHHDRTAPEPEKRSLSGAHPSRPVRQLAAFFFPAGGRGIVRRARRSAAPNTHSSRATGRAASRVLRRCRQASRCGLP